jgi:MinD superfamily P-loop ATPase
VSAVSPHVKPKQLVVLSGKGGTGKTSVVAALASLAQEKVLADCDVDAPDLHLVLAPVRLSRDPFFSGRRARIKTERCSQCGDCLTHCRFGAIRTVESAGNDKRECAAYEVDPLACEGCGLCAEVCVCDAVEMVETQQGDVFVSDTRSGPLVHARLAIGGENSGRLVGLLRERALAIAEEMGAGLVLVDGPPGIGCPVIASVTGADLVLLVTEPTVSGLHDLERVAELVRGFGRPLAVCLNKREINRNVAGQVRTYCEACHFPVLGELSYDLAVARAQTEGKSIVEYGRGPIAGQIAQMWDAIQEMLLRTEE